MRITETRYYSIGDIWDMRLNCTDWLVWIKEWMTEWNDKVTRNT